MNRTNAQATSASLIPYQYYADNGVMVCDNGSLLAVFECTGWLYECADDQILNRQRDLLNQLLRTIAHPRVSLWATTYHKKLPFTDQKTLLRDIDQPNRIICAYQHQLEAEILFDNRWYVSLLLASADTDRQNTSILKRGLKRPDNQLAAPPSQEHLDKLAQLCDQVRTALAPCTPTQLKQSSDSGPCALMGFLSELVNGLSIPRQRPFGLIAETLQLSDVYNGWDTLEIRNPHHYKLAAMLGIREYPHHTHPGMLDRLFTAPFEWTLTQSFTMLPKTQAQGLLARQQQRLKNTNDPAITQQQAIDQALDALTSNEFVIGEHHLSLMVTTGEIPHHTNDHANALKELGQNVSVATHLCNQAGLIMARESLALESAYWAQLPGNHRWRSRKVPLTSRNIASLVSLHSIAKGRARHNPWGAGLLPLKTSAGSVYHFSFHPTNNTPSASGDAKRGDGLNAAHTFICGPTGSGKTVLAALLISTLSARAITQVVFDKDQGLRQAIEQLNGRYEVFNLQGRVHLNPLSLKDNPHNRQFLARWLKLLMPNLPGATALERELDAAVSGVMALPVAERRLSRLREFCDPTTLVGPYTELRRWSTDAGGHWGEIFDGGQDDWQPLFDTGGLLGIDMTEAFKDDELREPLSAYLFHLIDSKLNGQPCVVWIDEFSRFLKDAAFSEFVDNACRTWRKRNGVMVLLTQSPSDIAQSSIARTLIEQMPTRIFFPNSNAHRPDYCELYGLNQREFELISKILPARSRQFLIKQHANDVIAELNLSSCIQLFNNSPTTSIN